MAGPGAAHPPQHPAYPPHQQQQQYAPGGPPTGGPYGGPGAPGPGPGPYGPPLGGMPPQAPGPGPYGPPLGGMPPQAPGPQQQQQYGGPPMQQQQQQPPQYGPPPTPPQQLAGSRAVVSAASTPAPAPQRIDPSAIPRPKYSNPLRPTRYRTTGEGQHVPPAAWSDFIAEDTGNVNPRFVRASLAHVPATRDVLKESRVPLSLIITPLAATAPGERPVTVVDFGAEGPIRCVRCRGYINRFVRWGEGGRVWGCNLCGARNECPGYYQGSIDQYGQRLDKHDRPELRDASVEFVAPPHFCVRPPAPMGVMFLVETTAAAVASGATRTALEAIRASLDGLAAAGMRAGLLTFDACVHGYDIAPERRALRQVIAGDVDDGFAPLPPDQGMPLVAAARHQWEPLLERVLALFPPSASRAASACTGAALKAGVDALTECGGRVVLFAASLPSHGEGKLVHRERPGVYGSEKEKELCVPQVGSPATAFYQDLARTAASKAVSVHINVLSASSIDLGTMAALVGVTGGDARIYPSFAAPSAPGPAGSPGAGPGGLSKPPIGAPPGAMAGAGAAPSAPLGASQLGSSGVGAAGGGAAAAGEAAVPASVLERVVAETRELLCRETAVEAVLKVRTSPGVKVTGYLGNLLERGDDEADLPTLDSEKAVLAMLQHDGHELKDGEDIFVQAAVLFTTGFGARRVRVHNLWLKSTENLQAVFRHADIDTILSTLVRNAIASIPMARDLVQVERAVTEQATEMLHSYRKHCAPHSSPGQLILPESLKLLPVYLSALYKTAAFVVNRPQPAPGPGRSPYGEVAARADVRLANALYLNSLTPSRLVPFIYPRLYALHRLGGWHGIALDSDDDLAAASDPDAPGPARPAQHPSSLSHEQLQRVLLPPTTYPSMEQLSPHGLYLLEHAAGLTLLVGPDCDEETVREVFGPAVPAATALPKGTELPELDTEWNVRLWTIIAAIRSRRPPFLPLTVVVPADLEGRGAVARLFAEDKFDYAPSYVDLLCEMHTSIQKKLTAPP